MQERPVPNEENFKKIDHFIEELKQFIQPAHPFYVMTAFLMHIMDNIRDEKDLADLHLCINSMWDVRKAKNTPPSD